MVPLILALDDSIIVRRVLLTRDMLVIVIAPADHMPCISMAIVLPHAVLVAEKLEKLQFHLLTGAVSLITFFFPITRDPDLESSSVLGGIGSVQLTAGAFGGLLIAFGL